MRLDKYLKVTHLIKRRGTAKDYIDGGFAFVNGKPAKPATKLNIGDTIALGESALSPRLKVEVLQLQEYCPLDEIKNMYRVLSSQTETYGEQGHGD